MSHFSDIGFSGITREQFAELNKEICEAGEQFNTAVGDYYVLKIEPRIEFWVCIPNDKSKEPGCNPYFNGVTENIVRISDVIPSDYSDMENAYSVWINEGNVNDTQEYPFIFDSPNFSINDSLIGKEALAQVTAFAESELSLYEDEAEFTAEQKKKGHDFFGTHTFVPSGQFVQEGQKQVARAMFAGEVKRVEILKNSRTGYEFYWLVVNSLDADYDIVVDPKMTNKIIEIGNIIFGSFWLSGKIIKVL